MKPKKHFSQNFLTSEAAIARTIRAGDICPGDIIVEIGPGKGALTKSLLESTAEKVIVIERDRDMVTLLQEAFAVDTQSGRLQVISDDFLNIDLNTITAGKPYRVVANIPFHITGAIIEHLLSSDHQPHHVVLIVQKEIVDRIVARDNKHSILSLSVWVYGKPGSAGIIKAGSFFPKPKVDAGILVIKNISRKHIQSPHHEETFFQAIKAGFAQKRKLVRNNLSAFPDIETHLANCEIDSQARAEDIRLDQWLCCVDKLVSGT